MPGEASPVVDSIHESIHHRLQGKDLASLLYGLLNRTSASRGSSCDRAKKKKRKEEEDILGAHRIKL